MAGHVRFELRNVGANYPFERSHGFPGIKPNSGHRDYSRLSCDVGIRSSGLGGQQRVQSGSNRDNERARRHHFAIDDPRRVER